MAALRAEEGGRGRRVARRARVVGTVLLVVLVLAVGTWLFDPEIDGTSARDRLRGLVPDEPKGTYAFLLIAREGGAVGWDPCEPIEYVVNPEGAPGGWESFTEAAVSAVAEASGFDFTYAGTSEARPLDESGFRGAPLLISWADPGGSGARGGVVRRRIEPRRWSRRTAPTSSAASSCWTSRRTGGWRAKGDARASELMLTHELGHTLGLADVDDHAELDEERGVRRAGRFRTPGPAQGCAGCTTCRASRPGGTHRDLGSGSAVNRSVTIRRTDLEDLV